MKYLVLGSNGMAGHMISLYLAEKGHDVTGVARQKKLKIKTLLTDVTNFDLLKKHIIDGNYDYIVNCVGVLNEKAEYDKAYAVLINSYLPHFVSNVTKNMKTKIIHLSTDCVFSGERGYYSELDKPDGSTFYDKSKALGELIDNKNITLRNSIIGPDINVEGVGLFNWFMKQKEPVKGFKNVIWNGITTLELAIRIEEVSSMGYSGIYSITPKKEISKLDLLNLFNKIFRFRSISITPVDIPISNKTLLSVKTDWTYQKKSYDEMLIELNEWIKKHSEIYAHYGQ